jgi:GcrA cell cycle regulator
MGLGFWTDEREAELKRLWAEGYTGSQIADAIGSGLTRSAIMGKIHRLGLDRRKQVVFRPKPTPGVVRRRLAAVNGTKFVMVDEVSLAPNPTSAPPTEVVVPMPRRPTRRTLWDLEPHVCHWLEGHGGAEGFWYTCHEKAVGGTSWCALHTRMVYQPPRRR